MPGDKLSLRQWSGKPYRSKQIVLLEAVVSLVRPCDITDTSVAVSSYAVGCDDFARADGFKNFSEMRDWFAETYGLPFDGILIQWRKL